jgi:RHS repeat-associated protein
MNDVAQYVVHSTLPRQVRIWHGDNTLDRHAAIFPKLLIAALCWTAMFFQQIEACSPDAFLRTPAVSQINCGERWDSHSQASGFYSELLVFIFSPTAAYDDAGYVVSDGKRTYQWASFGQLRQLDYLAAPDLRDFSGNLVHAASRVTSTFDFDSGGNRARQTKERIAANDSRKIEFTLYLGSYEREIHQTKANGAAPAVLAKTVHRHSLGGGVIYTRTVGTSVPDVRLSTVLADHLGSTDVIVTGKWNTSTAAFANITTERQSFDAWGERRAADTQVNFRATDSDAFRTSAQEHHRGYTGHEQLDDSGRIYDPELGRFLSPDPYVQIPEYSQNFNRYSYVLNNPLNATDPSGFSFLSKFFSKVGSWIKENWRTVAFTVVLTAMGAPYPIALGTAGAVNTALAGGNLKDIGIALVSGFIDGYASQQFAHLDHLKRQ